jgi:hypothetical protein
MQPTVVYRGHIHIIMARWSFGFQQDSIASEFSIWGPSALQVKGPVRIQYKCLVPIDVFPEMKLCASLFPKQNYNVLSLNFHIHVSVSDLYISTIGLTRTNNGIIQIAHRCMNVEIGNEAAQFYSGNICFKLSLQCKSPWPTQYSKSLFKFLYNVFWKNQASIQRPSVACYSSITERISSSVQFYWGFWA